MRRDELFTQPDWYPDAPCATGDVPPDAWFPEQGDNGYTAIAVCAGCPFRAPCLAGAVERRERFGFWGGVSIAQYRKSGRAGALRLDGQVAA